MSDARTLTVGSLFAGIGGFDLGFERAGYVVRWQIEIDDHARCVLEKHWPLVQRERDVRDAFLAGPTGYELSHVDYIVGGFPCQDLSPAGKRAGIDGSRSGLWREGIRIIERLRPRGVVLENVHHTWRRWVPIVRRALWSIGYPSLPIRLQAKDFGAQHERRRCFVIAHTDPSKLRLESWRRAWPFWTDPALLADADSARFTDLEGSDALEGVSRERPVATDADSPGQLQPGRRISNERQWSRYGRGWEIEPAVVRVVHGVPSRLDGRRLAARIAALGNAVIPIEIEWIAERLREAETEGAVVAAK